VAKFSTVFVLVNGAMISFTFSNAFGKELMNKPVGYVTFIEFTLVRSLFTMSLSYTLLRRMDVNVKQIASDMRFVLLSRCIVGCVAFLVTALAMKEIPLSVYTLIMSTNPFITAIL